MNAMVSRMASLVFVYGLDMTFDALAEMLLQLWTNALRIPTAAVAKPSSQPGPGCEDSTHAHRN
jgi:hypothetical protein